MAGKEQRAAPRVSLAQVGFPQAPALADHSIYHSQAALCWASPGGSCSAGGTGQASSLQALPNLSGNFLWGFHLSVALRGPVAKSF